MKTTLPNPLTPEAKREQERFLAAYNANLERAKCIALSILIWGPDPTHDSPVSRKRSEIRDRLIKWGHNAMFSEDIESNLIDLSEKSKEHAQALAAHLILILIEDSPGALAEAHDFCNDPEIAQKVFVLAPRRYKAGYSGKGALKDLNDAHGGVYWYTDNDLSVCQVCKAAVARAEALRQLRLRGGTIR